MVRHEKSGLTGVERLKSRYRHVLRAFLGLVQQAGEATSAGADAVADGVLSADERAMLEPLLDELIGAAVEFRALVRGG